MLNAHIVGKRENVNNHLHKNLIISETRLFLQPLYYFYFTY